MRRSAFKFALVATIAMFISASVQAQWNTPAIDGTITSNEYGTNNKLDNAGNTGQTWYMTWDASNLYVAIVNANVSEGAVLYVKGNPQNPATCCTNADGSSSGFNYDGAQFSTLPFRAAFVTYFKNGYREYRNSDGNNGWTGSTAYYGQYADNGGNNNTREVAIPWSAITGGGMPSSFAFFGYLTSGGGYVYGQAPPDNPGAFVGTSATATQYYAVVNTGKNTSTPPFSLEQPSGFSAADSAGFRHDTFDPIYRDQEGAVPENAQVTLRFTTLHSSGIWGVKVRAYLFDTATGNTTGPIDTDMPFDQNLTVNGTELDAWKATLTMPSATTVYYYKFRINRDQTNGWYSDDYLDDNDNVHKDGTGKPTDGEPFNSFQITVYDPNFQTPAWLQQANVYHILPDRFRNGDQTNDYCRTGSTTGCPSFYGTDPSTVIHYDTWNAQMCDPRDSSSSCYNNFTQFYNGDLPGVQSKLDYIQSLGFDTIYMNPIFMARSYHRYDTDQYLQIDPALGGDAAFTSLIAEMNRRGMQVILDGVFNHASSDGLYFDRYHRYASDGACESLSSVWRSWFHFNDDNVPCNSSDYPAWFGFDSLPTFDHTNPAVKDFFYRGPNNVTQYWYSRGASGWRFDVADDGNFGHPWWNDYRSYAKKYNVNGPLIGEIWPNASQYLAGDQMDSVMNYRFRKNIIGFARNAEWHDDNNNGTNDIPGLSPSQFDHAIRAVRDDYPGQATAAMLNLLDSHDVNRALYVLTETGDSGLTQAKQRLELAALFQFAYVGAPMVYYGDEVAVNSPSKSSSGNGPYGDPYTRPPYPWTDQAGDPSIYGPPDTSVSSYYTKLSHLRKQYPALRNGAYITLLTGDTQQPNTAPNTYAFARMLANESSALVAMNNGAASNAASIPVAGVFSDGTQLQDAISLATYSVTGGNVQVTLSARTGVVLLPYPVNLDLAPPSAFISTSPAANSQGWINSLPVTVDLSANDSGSGVQQLRYWINDGPVSAAAGNSASTRVTAEGPYTVGLRAIDNAGNISAPATATFGVDVTPPVVRVSVSPPSLWPANGAMVPVTVSGFVTDSLSGVDPSTASFAVVDEYGTVQPQGPVSLARGGSYSFKVFLRASRNGNDLDGRKYAITVSARDNAGNLASSAAIVTVPHDMGH
ncbi:alpha-amylase family glycosyl hydrolase [Occallatibacter riparius]|uniref:Alpha-amylase family glycosyl hydrolase n=1 Tax=Occallatibacter riparius TaxID=1002689 RepID=A0A9J7BM01_9BACT|nr:alpha-amylase family glycosyl hydrolase [Occallatibacter riparius]UWZ83521.1 alpha-amylase family glycosyl hydrolase [Occallatibacter riparius]